LRLHISTQKPYVNNNIIPLKPVTIDRQNNILLFDFDEIVAKKIIKVEGLHKINYISVLPKLYQLFQK